MIKEHDDIVAFWHAQLMILSTELSTMSAYKYSCSKLFCQPNFIKPIALPLMHLSTFKFSTKLSVDKL